MTVWWMWLACTEPERGAPTEPSSPSSDLTYRPEVEARIWELSDAALASFEAGDDAASILGWLGAEPDVVAVSGEAGDASLFFLVDGGKWAGVIGPDAARAAHSIATTVAGPKVVANGTQDKSALVLAAFASDFGAADDAPAAAAALSDTPDYTGRVASFANDAVTEDHLVAVGDYGVVHLSTHGAVQCDPEGGCTTIVALAGDPDGPDVDTIMTLPTGERAAGVRLVDALAWSDAGLNDAFILASACSSAKTADAGNLVQSAGGTYVGWTADVSESGSKRFTERFYAETLGRGRSVAAAVDALRSEGVLPVQWTRPVSGAEVTADIAVFGGDVHLREVVELRDQGARMEDDDRLRWIGEAGDGVADVLVADVYVYGVEPGREDDWEVHFELDGRSARGTLIPSRDGAPTADDAIWHLEGEVELGFDLDPAAETVELVARVPAKDSRHTVLAAVGGPRLEIVSTLTLIGGGRAASQSIVAEVPLTEKPGGGFEGSGPLTFDRYQPIAQAPPGQCTTTWTIHDGGVDVYDLQVPGNDLDDGEVPTYLAWWPYDLYAELLYTCGPLTLPFDDRFWFSGLLSGMYESGQFVEYDGFVMHPGQPGTEPGVAATWQVDTTYLDPDVAFAVSTTLTLRTR